MKKLFMINKPIIIVTGAAGMIALHTIKLLSQKYPDFMIIGIDSCNPNNQEQFFEDRIEALSHISNFKMLYEDLCSSTELENILKNESVKIIIHLAAKAGVSESYHYPHRILHNNYHSFLNVLEQVRIYSPTSSVIYASTSSVYGNNNNLTSENSELNPISSYGISKIQNEQIADLYRTQYGLNIIGLRFFTAYGEYSRKDMFIYKALESIQNNIPLTLYHQGNMQRDFTYCGDIAAIILKLIEQTNEKKLFSYPILNVGTGQPVSILKIINLLESLLNNPANMTLVDNHPTYDPLVTHCDNEKLLKTLGDFTFTSIEQGLSHTSQWYKKINFR